MKKRLSDVFQKAPAHPHVHESTRRIMSLKKVGKTLPIPLQLGVTKNCTSQIFLRQPNSITIGGHIMISFGWIEYSSADRQREYVLVRYVPQLLRLLIHRNRLFWYRKQRASPSRYARSLEYVLDGNDKSTIKRVAQLNSPVFQADGLPRGLVPGFLTKPAKKFASA